MRVLSIGFFLLTFSAFTVFADVPQKQVIEIPCNGIAYNLQADTSGGILFTIKKTSTGDVYLEGSFDNLRLFGEFKAPMESGFYNKENKTYTLTFKGNFTVGDNDNSGFPSGTKTYFKFTIVLSESGGTAIYVIGPLKEKMNYEQFAVVHYNLKRSIFTPTLNDFFDQKD